MPNRYNVFSITGIEAMKTVLDMGADRAKRALHKILIDDEDDNEKI